MSTKSSPEKPAASRRRTIMNIKSLPRAKRESLRERAFEMFGRGLSAYAVGIALRIRNQTACAWKRRFDRQGPGAYPERKRGPAVSKAAKLTASQCRKLVGVIVDKTPDQLKFPFALWSSKAVQEYVLRQFGVQMCRRSARRYMARLGFRNRVPERYAREQRPESVRRWLERQYPAIRREAQKKGAKELWCDEAAVLAGEIKTHGYAPKGTAPKLRAPANRGIRSSYSPEPNPDEYLNRDTKAHMAERAIPASTPAIEAAVGEHLKRRSEDKEFVKRLFHKKEVRYAAEP